VDSIEAASSDGDEGGVSSGERMDVGVVGRVDIGAMNLNTGVLAGGVGGFIGWIERGDGGRGGIDSTVAISEALPPNRLLVEARRDYLEEVHRIFTDFL
jgi:hypothetical protein